MIIPSTTVSALRTNEASPPVDAWGDAVEADTVVASAMPAWVEQATARRMDPASGRMVTIEGWKVLLRPISGLGYTPAETDRLKDERTGEVYQVETVYKTTGFMNKNVRMFCTQVR